MDDPTPRSAPPRIIFAPIRPGAPLFDAFTEALSAAALPTEDLASVPAIWFALVDGLGPAAFVGLEGMGEDLILRSLVVVEDRRGDGVGRIVVDRTTSIAAARGAKRLWTMPGSAELFFARQGWARAAAKVVPPAIAGGHAADAVWMVRDLRP